MSIEGSLRIELLCRDDRIRRVRIHSSRPLQLPLLFEGKPVEEVLQTIPMLYSICATAQARAAAGACRQALGVGVDARVDEAESMLVWFETAREHLWRVLIDWPEFLDEPVDRQQLPGLSMLIPDARRALFDVSAPAFTLQPRIRIDREAATRLMGRLSQILQKAAFGMPAETWYALDTVQALEAWIARRETAAGRYLAYLMEAGMGHLGQSEIEALPDMDTASLHQRLQQQDADAFVATPEWEGAPRETGPLTRQLGHPLMQALQADYGRGLLSRVVARLLELASIPARLAESLERLCRDETESLTSGASRTGRGVGVVDAARGRLVHRAEVSQAVIARYQILAPTEWNFHPRGLVAQGLLGLPCGYESTMRRQASLFINAVDPCVGFSFEFV